MADFLDNTQDADPNRCERALLIGVQTQTMEPGEAQELLIELTELVENLHIVVVATELVNLREPNPKTLLGKGKTDQIIAHAKHIEADLIVLDESLSPGQQRNWEKLSGIAVIDREEVILDIFADRAQTREAVLQIALARMEYSLPRLARAWTHLSRQRGSGNLGGEGETQLEIDRRLVRDRITRLKSELVVVQKQRGVQRQKRLRVPVPTASIVGYTNAGKSSLVNSLTGSDVGAEDKLFATLDPTTRQLLLRGNQKLLVTDTVGFIRRLPHRLVESFKATLEETIVADFLIHVIDVTNPNFDKHHATTLSVLSELGAADKSMITVFNKIDVATPDQIQRARLLVPEAIFASAHSGDGLKALEELCLDRIADAFGSTELLIPHDRYDVVSKLHGMGHIEEQEHREDGVFIRGRFPVTQTGFFEAFVLAAK